MLINDKNFHYLFRIGKRTRPYFLRDNKFVFHAKIDRKSEDINNLIFNLIKGGKPLMVGRFGSTESRAIANYLDTKKKFSFLQGATKYLKGEIGLNWKQSEVYMNDLCKLSGFFPNDIKLMDAFVQLYLESAKNLDILGVWNNLEQYIPTIPEDVTLCNIRELEPWFFDNPWSKALEGKKVLVIHPFEDTIKSQFLNRESIYKNPNILPLFDLKTIKAVQTIADEKSPFATWFDALDSMKREIDNIDFDIAVLGCGAYGLPLASYIKDKGKQAIHLGGVTQLLFGIKGKRWEDWEHYTSLRKNGWTFASEKPKGFEKVEGGCYW